MAKLIKKIRTDAGDLQIDYNALANLPALNTMFSNPNLLINSDFRKPVNQRGQTSYSIPENTYTIDRWKVLSNAATLSVHDGYIKLSSDNSTSSYFVQKIENILVDDYITVSINVKSLTGVLNVHVAGESKEECFSIYSSGVTTYTTSVKFADFMQLNIEAINDATVELYWAKVERGVLATQFAPRLYNEEFILCQRYYQTTRIHRTIRSDVYNEEIIETIPYGIELRRVPTLTSTPVNSFNVHDLSTSDDGDTRVYRVVYKLSSDHGTGHMFELNLAADAEIY